MNRHYHSHLEANKKFQFEILVAHKGKWLVFQVYKMWWAKMVVCPIHFWCCIPLHTVLFVYFYNATTRTLTTVKSLILSQQLTIRTVAAHQISSVIITYYSNFLRVSYILERYAYNFWYVSFYQCQLMAK